MIDLSYKAGPGAGYVVLPRVFFAQYLPRLEDRALRLYLQLCYLIQSGAAEVEEDWLALSLAFSREQLASALTALTQVNLIKVTEAGIELLDLKPSAYSSGGRAYSPRQSAPTQDEQVPATAAPVSASAYSQASIADASEPESVKTDRAADNQPARVTGLPLVDGEPEPLTAREEVIRQINNAYYQGVMPLVFYRKIEEWIRNYHFEPEVVYALFNELRQYQKLHNEGYASAIAARWHEEGIRTFDDLNRLYEDESSFNRFARQIQQKLRQKHSLSSYQREFLQRWVGEWQFSYELVDEAFRRAAAQSRHNNFPYVEGILRNWQAAGLKTREEVTEYEAKQRKSYARKNSSSRTTARPSNVGNFSQREYSEDFYRQFDRSLDFLDDEGEKIEP